MVRVPFVLLATVLLGACSTTPISPSQARFVKPLAFGIQQPGTVPITFVRDSGAVGFDCSIEILINNVRAISFQGPSEKSVVWIKPAPTILTAVSPGRGWCPHRQASLSWSPLGQITVFRTGWESGSGGIELTPGLTD